MVRIVATATVVDVGTRDTAGLPPAGNGEVTSTFSVVDVAMASAVTLARSGRTARPTMNAALNTVTPTAATPRSRSAEPLIGTEPQNPVRLGLIQIDPKAFT